MWALLGTLALADQGTWAFPSGLHVIFYPDDRYPVANVALVIGAGNGASGAAQPDLAHLTEHLAFQIDDRGDTLQNALSSSGCAWNATTAVDTTAYFARCPAVSATSAITSLLGVLEAGLPGLEAVDVAREAVVVRREYAMRTSFRQAYSLLGALYGPNHPYGTGGLPREGAPPPTLADVQAFHRENYVPGKAVLVVTGAFSREDLARGLIARPGLLVPGATEDALRVYPVEQLAVLGYGAPARWLPDPKDPTRPLPITASRGPARRVDRELPELPASRLAEVDVAESEPSWRIAWKLPPSNYLDYFQYDAVASAVEVELAYAARGDANVGCAIYHGRLASTLACNVSGEDLAGDAGMERRLTEALAGPWSLHVEQRVQEAFVDDRAQTYRERVERDAGGVSTAVDAGEHFLQTDNPVYFSEKYQRMAFDQAFYVGVRDVFLTPERATLLRSRPYGAPAVEGVGAEEAHSPSLSAVRDDPAPLLTVVHQERFSNGHQILIVADHGTYGQMEVAFPASADPEVVRAVALGVEPRTKHRGRAVWSDIPQYFVTPKMALFDVGLTPGRSGDWIDDWAFLISAHALGGRVHAPRAADRAARVIRRWRYPAYWAEQRFLEALGGEDRVWGSSIAEVMEARAAAADARASVLDPRFATTFLVGPYKPSDVVPSFEKRFGKGAPGPARPVVAPRVPAVTEGVELYAPLADTGLADVTARCVVDVGDGDAGHRYAVSRVVAVLLNHTAAELLRGQSQAAYAVGAEVDWSDDAGAWLARIGALVAPSDAGFGVRQLRASASAAAQATPSEVLSAIAAARAELRPGSTLDAAGLIEDLLALGLDAPAIASLDASFASVTAADVSRALGACVSGARVAVTAPEAAVRASLEAVGFAPEPVPWRDQQRARTDALAGRWAKEERAWRERHPAR